VPLVVEKITRSEVVQGLKMKALILVSRLIVLRLILLTGSILL
jgi:hypothetical protein